MILSDGFPSWGQSSPFLTGTKVGDACPSPTRPSRPIQDPWGKGCQEWARQRGCPGVGSSAILTWV